MKLTHNEEPKEFKPFSITITFESEQEAVNMLHYLNVENTEPVQEAIMKYTNKEWPAHNCMINFDAFTEFKKLLKSKGIIK